MKKAGPISGPAIFNGLTKLVVDAKGLERGSVSTGFLFFVSFAFLAFFTGWLSEFVALILLWVDISLIGFGRIIDVRDGDVDFVIGVTGTEIPDVAIEGHETAIEGEVGI